MNGFASLITEILRDNGVSGQSIRHRKAVELPGYYRPTKKWDLLVIDRGRLLAAMEFKSQVGPSFGNNVNNRIEEAIGSAVDLHRAYSKGAFAGSPDLWLGYLFLLHKDSGSVSPVGEKEPNFRVFPEFRNASYARRYELLCQRLVTEGLYNASCFLLATRSHNGSYEEPNATLSFQVFMDSLISHVVSETRTGPQSTMSP